MNSSVVPIFNALCLPAVELEALISGQTIAAIPHKFIRTGQPVAQNFALCPVLTVGDEFSEDSLYHARVLKNRRIWQQSRRSDTLQIEFWARCELCQGKSAENLDKLSRLTIWRTEALQTILSKRSALFLAYLRVYRLPEPVEFPLESKIADKIGKFIGLPQPLETRGSLPILSDRLFDRRRQQLENLEPPPHPELEELQGVVAEFSLNHPRYRELEIDLRNFLGWSVDSGCKNDDPDLDWIQRIARVGNSSEGQEFEKLVRRSLIKLGFGNSNPNPKISLDPDATGGAGGLDFYCDLPYAVVGECKATKTEKVPDGTPAQLVKLGQKHLQLHYADCIKIIMAAGELTTDAERTAKGNQMNVIRPETLQRLVEMKAKYPGSIDLFELKPCLETEPFGSDADVKVNEYIDRIEREIRVRSHLLDLIENMNREVGIDYLNGAYDTSNPPQSLSARQMHEILVELSSPLTGYLGRKTGRYWKEDRFYFLRQLGRG